MLQQIERETASKVLRACGRLRTCRTATPSLHACRSQGLQPHRAWQDLPGGGGWCSAPRDVRAGGQRSEPTRKQRLPRQCRASNRGAHGRHRCCTDPTATACACQHVADSPQCHLHSCCCCCRRSGELCASRWRCELGVHHLSASHYPRCSNLVPSLLSFVLLSVWISARLTPTAVAGTQFTSYRRAENAYAGQSRHS